jgi:hypothetical protein
MLALLGAIGFGTMWYWIRVHGHHPKTDVIEEDGEGL